MPVFCNPVNGQYRYQFIQDPRTGMLSINREAADPSLILYHGRYYMYASMTLGVWVSDDLAHWENYRLPDELPLYDYAPDVRVIDDAVILSASKRDGVCHYYRTKDPIHGPYEEITGSFAFWDPNLFQDDDGRVYFYWGCSSEEPLYGVEVDPKTLRPIGEKRELILGEPSLKGFERIGENHSLSPRSEEEIDAEVRAFLAERGMTVEHIPPEVLPMIRGMFSQKPFIEGAWMTKHEGRYYLQYACPGTEYNTYADGVYVGSGPLGPFTLAENNPFSYHPGGFMPGAGHGSTMADQQGKLWHTATMRISVHHNFERRIGLWRAGFDDDGVLFCNQRYGDWPLRTETEDPWAKPEWYLLSYGKQALASSCMPGHEADKITDENAQTWWQAESSSKDEWVQLDLGKVMDVRAIQINFADSALSVEIPGTMHDTGRYIDDRTMYTRWALEVSADGVSYRTIKDKSQAQTDLPHDFLVWEGGFSTRYIRLRSIQQPYGQQPCLSGLRVFGFGGGEPPHQADFTARRIGPMDLEVEMRAEGAIGYNILWGMSPDKLYHSYLTFTHQVHIGALVKGKHYYLRVDAFNESGITEGSTVISI